MKTYSIRRSSKQGYETQIITNNETQESLAEYRLTPGLERAEMSAMRRSIDRHMGQAAGTFGNYQW